jgi:hypothetical protein
MTMTEDTTINGAIVPVGGFDYDALSQDVANAARDVANRIRDHQSNMAKAGTEYGRGLIAIGKELLAIKDSLPHGH